MDLVIFSRATAPMGAVYFSRNPLYGIGKPFEFKQPKDLSDGGVLYSYDKGVVVETFELTWRGLSLTDWTSLKSFIENVAVGSKNNFDYIDEDSLVHTVRCVTEELDFREVAYESYNGTLKLRKE